VAVIAVATGSKAWPPIVAVAANPAETRRVKLPPPPKPITIPVAATTLRVPWPAIVIVVAARAPNPSLRGPKSVSRPGPSGPKPRGPRPKLEIQLVPLGESGPPSNLLTQAIKLALAAQVHLEFHHTRHVEETLGPVDIHRTHIIAPTKKSMDRYDSAVFSYRVAILR
jgi:hypothetical protein